MSESPPSLLSCPTNLSKIAHACNLLGAFFGSYSKVTYVTVRNVSVGGSVGRNSSNASAALVQIIPEDSGPHGETCRRVHDPASDIPRSHRKATVLGDARGRPGCLGL